MIGIQFPVEAMMELFFRHRVHTGSVPPPASYPMVTGYISPGVKRPGREADHLIPYTAEITKAWSCTSTSPKTFHGAALC
jgi:hypothetical protein